MVYIILLNWNGWQDTIESLESLQHLKHADYRIVVVENGSDDGSLEKIKAWAAGKVKVRSNYLTFEQSNKPVHWVEYDKDIAEAGGIKEIEDNLNVIPQDRLLVLINTGDNLGYAGGNNVGIQYALKREAEFVWILNNDVVVDKNALTEMLNLAETDSHVGMVGSKVLSYYVPKIIQAAGGGTVQRWKGKAIYYGNNENDNGQWDKVLDVEHIIGVSLLVRSKLIKTVGFLDERFFLCMEEADWCIRALRNGWKLLYCPLSLIYHKGSVSFKRGGLSQCYYNQRNILLFTKKNYLIFFPIVLIGGVFLKIGKRLIKGDFAEVVETLQAHYDFLCGKLGRRIVKRKNI
jgi:GT2 family glycosyltransferase